MKEVIRDVLGFGENSFKVPMRFYESVEEADKAAGRAGATLDECNNNLAYRGSYADARELIVDIVLELTKVPLKQKDTGEKGADGKPILEDDEREKDYVNRALAATPAVTFDKVQSLITTRARGYKTVDPETKKEVEVAPIAVDITKKVRAPKGPKVLPVKFKETAKGILAANNVAKFNKASSKYGIAAFVATGKPEDETTLGWLCKAYAQAVADEANQSFSK